MEGASKARGHHSLTSSTVNLYSVVLIHIGKLEGICISHFEFMVPVIS